MRITDLEDIGRIVRRVRSHPRIVVSGNFASPVELTRAVVDEFETCRLHALNPQTDLPMHDGVTPETAFVGPGFRNHPRLSYVPSRLSMVPDMFDEALPPDIVLVHTTPPSHGHVSLGLEVNILPGAIEACRARGGLVIAQMNPQMPWTFGDSVISTELVDLAVEVDVPLPTTERRRPGHDAADIGERVAALIGDGATLQTGIGEIPDAALAGLSDRNHLRIWTEMFSDGVMNLEESGALDRDHQIVSSFIFGSQHLYDWVRDNPRVRMVRTETTNDPSRIAQQRRMVSINTALQVDLFDQANASRIRNRIYSGFGGQTDFTVGAIHSKGGHAIMALRSWHPRADVSTIVPVITEPVTSYQHSYVVTEQGAAAMWGHDEQSQARNLITQAAHPRVREELWSAAAQMGKA